MNSGSGPLADVMHFFPAAHTGIAGLLAQGDGCSFQRIRSMHALPLEGRVLWLDLTKLHITAARPLLP
jgi:hypothetical protein